MPLDYVANGVQRGTTDTIKRVGVGPQGNQLVNDLLPKWAQLVAEGRVWRLIEASAVASVTNLPTTTAGVTLANGEADDGLWYIILQVFAFNTANAAALDNWALAGCVQQNRTPNAAFVQDIARTSVKPMLSGGKQGPYNGNAVIDLAASITDDLWFPITGSNGSTAINSATGSCIVKDMDGLIVLPPTGAFSLISTATSTSNTTRKGFVWAEVPKSWLGLSS